MDIGVKAFVVFEGRTLLILRDDIPTIAYPNFWNLPGGGVEEGEDFDTALRRELMEEISIIPKNIVRMGTETFDDKRVVIRYLVRLEKAEAAELELGDEGQEMRFFTIDEMLQLSLPPYLGNFISGNRDFLKKIFKEEEDPIPERLGLVS